MTRRIDSKGAGRPEQSIPEAASGAGKRLCVLRSLACLLATPLLLLLSTQAIALQQPGVALGWMIQHPVAVFSTWLLVLAILLPVFGLTGRLLPAVLLVALPALVLTLVSYYKTIFNGMPLQLSDLALARSFFDIAAIAGPRIQVSVTTALAMGALMMWLVVCALQDAAFKKAIGKFSNLRTTGVRIPATRIQVPGVPVPLGVLAGAALVIAIVLFPLRTAAASAGETFTTQAERNEAYGYVWGFFVAASANAATPLSTLSDEQVESMLAVPEEDAAVAAPATSDARTPAATKGTPGAVPDAEPSDASSPSRAQDATPVLPTILFLMSESFFDITTLPNVHFSEDPLPNYHKLCETGTNGGFLSNTYAGGTGNVEMEMFTGISSSFIKESEALTSLSPLTVYSELPSIVKSLRAQGYRTTALHSHTTRLYNRTVTYPALGFEQVLFDESFPADVEMSGGYISDLALSEKMIALYEERNENEPFFLYTMSMENHGPYPVDKFKTPLDIEVTSPVLSESDLAILRSLTQGLRNADLALGRLLDYFSKVKEPVILVFCGDHLPGLFLSESETIYTKTGFSSTANTLNWEPDELARMLTADYAIWTNTGEPLWPDRTESSMVLGMHLLKAVGIPMDGFLGWLDRNVSDVMLLQRPRLFVDAQGNASSAPPEASAPVIDTYRMLIQSLLYATKYPPAKGTRE